MKEHRTPFQAHDAEMAPCTRCGEPYDVSELDRLLWCDRCRRIERDRASWWGWVIGLVFAALVAAYIWLVIRPTDLIIGGWVATVLFAGWIGAKLGREVMYGVFRSRHRQP